MHSLCQRGVDRHCERVQHAFQFLDGEEVLVVMLRQRQRAVAVVRRGGIGEVQVSEQIFDNSPNCPVRSWDSLAGLLMTLGTDRNKQRT